MSHTRNLFRRARFASALLAAGLVGALPAHAADMSHPFAKHKLVMSISQGSPERQQLVLNNTANVLRAFGQDNIRVEIVAFGPGLKLLLKNNPHAKVIRALKAEGVEFGACHNTMMAMHITKAALNPAATVVPGGIVELIRREEQGWSYVKP